MTVLVVKILIQRGDWVVIGDYVIMKLIEKLFSRKKEEKIGKNREKSENKNKFINLEILFKLKWRD
jgi:hypothetical protein